MATIRLPETNLYAYGYSLILPDGVEILKRDVIQYQYSADRDIIHQVVEDEYIWQISARYYNGEDKWWWVIADANSLQNPLELTAGDSLIIPDLEVVKTLLKQI